MDQAIQKTLIILLCICFAFPAYTAEPETGCEKLLNEKQESEACQNIEPLAVGAVAPCTGQLMPPDYFRFVFCKAETAEKCIEQYKKCGEDLKKCADTHEAISEVPVEEKSHLKENMMWLGVGTAVGAVVAGILAAVIVVYK